MGIGDHICLKGAVATIREQTDYEKINIFCKQRSEHLLEVLYNDNSSYNLIPITPKNVFDEYTQVQEKLNEASTDGPVAFLRVGFDQYREQPGKSCDESFYEMLGIPYDNRFTKFNFTRDYKIEDDIYKELTPENKDYIFVHDDVENGEDIFGKTAYFVPFTNEIVLFTYVENGYPINVDTDLNIVKNDITKNFFYFGKLFENAKEIHCMESSIRCLLEFYDLSGVELYCYKRLRGVLPGDAVGTRQNWKMV